MKKTDYWDNRGFTCLGVCFLIHIMGWFLVYLINMIIPNNALLFSIAMVIFNPLVVGFFVVSTDPRDVYKKFKKITTK